MIDGFWSMRSNGSLLTVAAAAGLLIDVPDSTVIAVGVLALASMALSIDSRLADAEDGGRDA